MHGPYPMPFATARIPSQFAENTMAIYESEHTKFMREWMAKHPEEAAEQAKGRALWWDKPQNLETGKQYSEAEVPQKAYYYQTGD